MSDSPTITAVVGLTRLVEQAERIVQHVFDEAEKKIRSGERLDISLRDAIYVSIRLAELRLGLPPTAPEKTRRDLSHLSIAELKSYRALVAKTHATEPPLDS